MMRNWTVVTVTVLAAALVVCPQRTGRSAAPAAAPAAAKTRPAFAAGATAPAAGRAAAAPFETAASCKPTVPLDVDLRSLGAGQWRLQCSSQDQDRDVTVWMWSGSESTRREVWHGRLQQGVSRVIDVGFTPTDAATPVWAAVEAIGPQGDGMRRLARVPLRNEPLPGIAASAAQLLQDPTTGESILQFTGQTEAGR